MFELLGKQNFDSPGSGIWEKASPGVRMESGASDPRGAEVGRSQHPYYLLLRNNLPQDLVASNNILLYVTLLQVWSVGWVSWVSSFVPHGMTEVAYSVGNCSSLEGPTWLH